MESANVKALYGMADNEIIKMPKNIRQIGITGQGNKIIYVEDYVISYMKQLADKDTNGLRVAVLLGYYIRTEDGKNIFIKGAVEMEEIEPGNSMALSEEGWSKVYENIKKYFTDVEIVGWALIGAEFFLEGREAIRKLHCDNFSGEDKALLKVEFLEKEESFYLLEKNQLVKQSGYYIYYEKNEEMQNYMIESCQVVSEEEAFVDKATPKIRTIIQDKKQEKGDKSVMRLLYTASTLMAIIVLVVAYTMLDNHQQMKNMEQTLQTLSESIQKEPIQYVTDEVEGGKFMAEEENVSNDQEMDVETISGNVVEEEDVGDEEKTVEDSREEIKNSSGARPDSTKELEPTKAPEPTKKPESAKEPEPTKMPEPTKTPEPTKAPKEEKETAAEIKYYIVEPGDSLAGITLKLYKSVNNMKVIKELNGIEDEDKIYVGQKLLIP